MLVAAVSSHDPTRSYLSLCLSSCSFFRKNRRYPSRCRRLHRPRHRRRRVTVDDVSSAGSKFYTRNAFQRNFPLKFSFEVNK